MQMLNKPVVVPPIEYPSSDGKPMADNTLQFEWIHRIEGNLEALFRDRADVFVAGDNLWYPVEEQPDVRAAPDVYVVFGRPKGYRGSYQQWLECGVPLTVVFEILSPGNTVMEMDDKLDFYDQYGVEEYYIYDPNKPHLSGWVRKGEAFLKVRPIKGHISPRLGIRFDMSGQELVIYHPNGKPFRSLNELDRRLDELDREHGLLERQYERLRELSRKLRLGQASPDELKELESLEGP